MSLLASWLASPPLEAAFLPTRDKVIAAVKQLVEY